MMYVSDVDQIYIPPLADLIVLQDELIRDYPQLTSRAQKAVDIVAERRLLYDASAGHWIAESKRDGGRIYQLTGQN